MPDSWRPGLMHGDYALNNVLFANRPPARLVAIIDWETATIGDPLPDVAGFTQHFPSEQNQSRTGYFDAAGFPRREDALAYYADRSGRDISNITYYDVLSRFRMACMIEYKVAESVQGLSPPAKGERFDGLVRGLLRDGEALARSVDRTGG